jgi:hypothetical protein
MLPAHRCLALLKVSMLSLMQRLFDFLCDAKRSGTEVQCEHYIALDEGYISQGEFKGTYELAGRTRVAISGFFNYESALKTKKKDNCHCERSLRSEAIPS